MDVSEITLRIVHVDDVIPHEEVDPVVVQRLAERLREDMVLRNPPVVAQADDKYVVLDGATRVDALKLLGVRDVLVQIVDYASPCICLASWHHVVQTVPPSALIEQIAALDGIAVEQVDAKHAEHALAIRTILCFVLLRNGAVYAVRGATDLRGSVAQLNHIVQLYMGHTVVPRVVTTQLDLLTREYPDLSAVIVFPIFTPAEVTRLPLEGLRLPAGITRHLIGGRALGTNTSLVRLMSDESLEAKNAWLAEWLMEKIHARKVRFYQEPVFVFDE